LGREEKTPDPSLFFVIFGTAPAYPLLLLIPLLTFQSLIDSAQSVG
jgi:hypothetical protein